MPTPSSLPRTTSSLRLRRSGRGARELPRAPARGASPGEVQRVRVRVRGGYEPAVIVAAAGRPLRVTFRREETAACSERVVFPAFGTSAQLPPFRDVTVELLPEEPGEYEFTCQFGMLRGRLIVTPAERQAPGPGSSAGGPRGRLRGTAVPRLRRERGGPVSLAVVAWICSLPLLLLVAVPFLGWKIAGLVALALLVVLLLVCFAVCVWRMPRPGAGGPSSAT